MTVNEKAAQWALTKVGYKYSQPKRLQEDYFDCSSLVARAYKAVGAPFTCKGAPVPLSNQEVYDDQFELVWPATYAQIGKKLGGREVALMAREPGSLQFLRTSNSSRANRITHIAMVADKDRIVHARGTAYGVRTDPITLYGDKNIICAVTRYNPNCELRLGHKGDRVRKLQRELNAKGANLTVDGDYGATTAAAVKKYGGGSVAPSPSTPSTPEVTEKKPYWGECTGATVNVRSGPSTKYSIIGRVNKGDKLLFLGNEDWPRVAVELNGELKLGYMSKRYIKEVK